MIHAEFSRHREQLLRLPRIRSALAAYKAAWTAHDGSFLAGNGVVRAEAAFNGAVEEALHATTFRGARRAATPLRQPEAIRPPDVAAKTITLTTHKERTMPKHTAKEKRTTKAKKSTRKRATTFPDTIVIARQTLAPFRLFNVAHNADLSTIYADGQIVGVYKLHEVSTVSVSRTIAPK